MMTFLPLYIDPGTGEAVTNAAKEDGALVNASDFFKPQHSKSKYVFTSPLEDWWRVSDSIFKAANWRQETEGEGEK